MPTPTPTNEQTETVREIAKLSSFADAQERISSLNDEQWAAMLADITAWSSVKNQFTRLKGGRSGVDIDPGRTRMEIRNRVRVRLGLSELTEQYGDENQTGSSETCSVPIGYSW
ncbi:MAG TPA: hypothetical protein VGC76_14535 [Pyrinomonadaceae bacterium]|jgi:hypothetical protein